LPPSPTLPTRAIALIVARAAKSRYLREFFLLHADLGDLPEEAWREDLDQLIFRGSRFIQEVVFFHRKTRTLVLADLIENFEPE
jgi:hypothetical protein